MVLVHRWWTKELIYFVGSSEWFVSIAEERNDGPGSMSYSTNYSNCGHLLKSISFYD